jgi:hypothetical protein
MFCSFCIFCVYFSLVFNMCHEYNGVASFKNSLQRSFSFLGSFDSFGSFLYGLASLLSRLWNFWLSRWEPLVYNMHFNQVAHATMDILCHYVDFEDFVCLQ